MDFGGLKSITFIFLSTFLLIGNAFSHTEQSSHLQRVELLEKHSREEYHALADEVFHRMKIPEAHEKIIKYSNGINNEKRKTIRDSLIKHKGEYYTEEDIKEVTDEYTKIWNHAYHEKLRYNNIKEKIINKIITKISYGDLNSINDVLKHGGKRGYTNQDKVTFVVILDLAKKASIEASNEAADETQLSLKEILDRLDIKVANKLIVT
jgi:hypothetical protein